MVSIHLVIGQDGRKQTVIGQVLGGEAVDQEPVEHPAHGLGKLLGSGTDKAVPLTESLFNKLLHLLERSVLDNISALSVEDLTGEESPEHLQHQLRVLLALVHQDLL